jgi:hypothetical protein
MHGCAVAARRRGRELVREVLEHLREHLGGRRDETCPVSTEGGTRRIHLVREGGWGWAGERALVTQSRRGLAGRAGARLCVGDGRVARMPALECHLDPLALHNCLVDRRHEPRRRRAPRSLERLEQKVCAAQRNLLGADCAHDLRHKTERKPEVEQQKRACGAQTGPAGAPWWRSRAARRP